MSKRKNGEGTWGTKTIKGKKYKYFRKQYEGMNSPKYFYGEKEKDIKRKIKKFEEKLESNILENVEKIVFETEFSKWLYNVKQYEVKRRTFDGYESTFINQIKKYKDYDLANALLINLSQDFFQDYYNSLATKYSLASINKNYSLINQFLNYAVSLKKVTDNFVKDVTLPNEDVVAVKEKEVPFLPEEDIEKLYQESKRINEKGYNFGGKIGQLVYGVNSWAIVLILYTGLRIGELTGLRWKDINFKTKEIRVYNNLSTIKNRDKQTEKDNNYIRVDTTVKSKKGYRDIPLYERALEMIYNFEKLSPNHKPDDYVAINKLGNVIGQRNVTRTLEAMLTRSKCSVNKCGLHSLRHSFGSYLISKGADIKVVSELLGHSTVEFTYRIYIHILPKQYRSTIDLFDKMGKNE